MLNSRKARVRVATATLTGEILLDGQRVPFEARGAYPRIEATFAEEALDGTRVDQWAALRALETFIDENLRG